MKFSCFSKSIIPLIFVGLQGFAQAGITASPSKMYYRLPAGSTSTQKVYVINPIGKNLEVGVSLGDWDYDSLGTNNLHDPGILKTSCANWVKVLPGSYFTLLPEERKELTIELTVPITADKNIPVHTAMLYFTQLNPVDSKSENGAAIKVSVRMGIKIYHSFTQADERNIEVVNFTDKKKVKADSKGLLELKIENTGKIWLDGKVIWELLNIQNGDKIKMENVPFLSLPGDKTTLVMDLPASLKKGHYSATAIVNYGNKDELKVVELEFET
ncbi:fimbrial biogenesis chaperone [Arcticibacter eurypsychrophilus]|uniref:hypothetical protein n=1 Tax=Arcticibacter eurypsychrophilus TaxID=1434752 RepID=UPI00084DBBDB|nr:hypothetical protein [Arcticibacter eurypsychrophilus]